MAMYTMGESTKYSWHHIDEEAGIYFYPDEIPEDFHNIFEKEMDTLLPENLIWKPELSEIWTGNGEGGDIEVSEEDLEGFNWDEAERQAFEAAVAHFDN